MERLTEYESIGGHAHAVPTGNIDTALMRLAAYEDTGYTPEEIAKLQGDLIQRNAELLKAKQNLSEMRYRVEYMDRDLKEACQKITNLKSRCVDMKNELCQYCGKYNQAHDGACDGCRWSDM